MAEKEEKKINETEGSAQAPKKKRYATVVRPQNSSTGRSQRPGAQRRPADAASSRRPADAVPPEKRHIRRVENRPDEEKSEVKAPDETVKPDTAAQAAPAETGAVQTAPAAETKAEAAASANEAPAAAEAPAEKGTKPAAPEQTPEQAPEKKEDSGEVRSFLKNPRFIDPSALKPASQTPARRRRDDDAKGDKSAERQGRPLRDGMRRTPSADTSRRPSSDRDFGARRDGQKGAGAEGRGAGRGFGARPGAPAGDMAGARGGVKRGDSRKGAAPAADFAPSSRGGKGASGKKERDSRDKNKQYGKGGLKEENLRNLNKQVKKQQQQQQQEKKEEVIKTIVLPEKLTVGELAQKMKIQPNELIKKLFEKGEMLTINSDLTYEQAEGIAIEYDILCEQEVVVDVIEELLKEEEENEATMVSRPPVVCVMGHVDHGKTSLLDTIRNTNVTSRESGGITQHIGAYQVSINDRLITFLDTPGHEAFTAMRLRGAQATDIAIIVVAADDGVMPQTVEAINHAKAAEVEIIVAVNKIDKPSANIDRVKQEMAEYGLVAEDWGGSTVFAPVSAKTGEGVDNLLEMVLLTADMKDLKANPNRKARGLVIEAKLDKGKGPVATVLVQKGTLKIGDNIAAGSCYGKVRAMIDDKGRRVSEALPSTPVEILGLDDVPNAGEIFVACENDKDARHFAETFIAQDRIKMLEKTKQMMTLDSLFSKIQEGNIKELNIVVKADVQGSVEAVRQSLEKLSNEEVSVHVIHGGVGAINESDVTLASASNAVIIGFNVRPDTQAKMIAERDNVDIKVYSVIYQAIADVEAAMKGMLDPVFEEKVIGHAEIRQLFKASGIGTIAGSYVLDGTIQRGCKVRITREGEQIFEGNLASLKRFKDDVKEVREKFECGLVFEGFSDIAELDIVEAYIMVEVPR